ncbi:MULTISPECIES: hypothetical protein [Bacillus cereus group]|uniref:Uncharacterized protein n=1 Tax=Bacillus thuringiensis serovar toumanoffi TaxID=180862 RepID=A0ABD5I713_BACTU|nr:MULTISPECIES: hypothetical protein [Bacillus cereus group]WIK95256.1 hypothetical protein QPL86_23325 [Bacillus bombysepticus]EEM94095.1 hypothetical protein bthur0013_46370 [Bacillus thuringiensis IBL 200]MCR6782678.1 hypothetical protein [Bacillus thuringiensis]MCR6860749.1 hypothetical protein [Bacillus thuringiensis]MCR6864031.1 hypothetical protein [Bacillus thuringiensis]
MTNQNYKRFILNNKKDYIIYLRYLIIQSYKFMNRHSIYINNLKGDIEDLNLLKKPHLNIDSSIYEEHNDRIQFISSKLLNLFGDLQGDALSYNKFRKKLVNRNIEVKSLLGKLPKEISNLLDSARDARNWGLHEPESLLVAHFENIKQLWPKQEIDYYLSNFTPIAIPMFKKYEGAWLISLYEECLSMQKCNEKVFEQMIKDYEILIQDKVLINDIVHPVRPFESEILLSKTSLQMQNRKYKA